MAKVLSNYVNGAWVQAANGATFEQRNPARLTEVTGIWPASTREDARAAVEAAEVAFASWSKLTPIARASYLKKALENMRERASDIAGVLTAENGKTIAESRAEVQSGIDEAEFQIHEGLRMYGETVPSRRDGVFAYSIRKPLGVVSAITPWNFPFNVPVRKIVPALMAGNTCVFKPASLTPMTGLMFTECFVDAEFPAGVLNFVTGGGSTVGAELTTNPAIRAISFTGSEEVGKRIHRMASEQLIKTQLEMGGKNPAIVLEDADLDAAAKSIVRAAYVCAGQWCTATSRVLVVKEVAEELTKRLLEEVERIHIGEGVDPNTDMGPVCGTEQLETIGGYLETGKKEGAVLLTGGNVRKDGQFADGCFIEPTVFGEVTEDMTIAREEIFGPVLAVMKVQDFDDAIRVANNVRFGLASAVYTKDLNRTFRYIEENDAGVMHVNLMTAIKEPHLSFGGVKESGHGLPEAGKTGIEFFTEHRVVYINYGR
ncbi:MAG: aldehyde dehydrogenase family protein [Spirochaetia bacterium]